MKRILHYFDFSAPFCLLIFALIFIDFLCLWTTCATCATCASACAFSATCCHIFSRRSIIQNSGTFSRGLIPIAVQATTIATTCILYFTRINIRILAFFDEFKEHKKISEYLSARDNIADDKKFYLCLKNINFIDSLRCTENDIPAPSKINSKRTKIDNNLRDLVWNTYIGEDNKKGKCFCCPRTIDYTKFECGHLISHKNGGKTDINNLRPFCFHCNRSLGSNNYSLKTNKINETI